MFVRVRATTGQPVNALVVPDRAVQEQLGKYFLTVVGTDDKAELRDLMKFVKGPDFPTGGIIIGREGIESTYGTGRGRIVVRGVAHIEESKNNRHEIVITEIPYQVNKTTLIERIAELGHVDMRWRSRVTAFEPKRSRT